MSLRDVLSRMFGRKLPEAVPAVSKVAEVEKIVKRPRPMKLGMAIDGGRRRRYLAAKFMSQHPSRRKGVFDAWGHKLSRWDVRCVDLMRYKYWVPWKQVA